MNKGELYRTAFDSAAIGISLIAVEPLGKYVEVNPTFCRMTGYAREELLERTFQSITLNEDLSRNIEQLNALLSGSSPSITIEKRYIRKDKTAFWARLNISLSQKPDGKPSFLIVQIEDIDAQKRTQQALEEADRRHRTLLGNLPGMAYRCKNDSNWTMEFVSEGCLDLTGYAPSDLVGNRSISYGNLVHPEDQSWLWDKCQVSLKAGIPCLNEYRIRTASGREKWVWEQSRGIYSEDGTLEAIEGFITDITERKQAGEALRESSRFNEQVITNAREGIIVYDREIRYLVWNRYMEEMTGLRAADVLEKRPPDLTALLKERGRMLVTQEIMDGIYASAKKALEEETITFFDVPWALKDGSSGWNSVRYGPFRNTQGDVVGVIATVWDITERKAAELELAARAHQQQAVAAFGHEALTVRNIGELMNRAVSHIADTLGVEYCKVLELLPGGRELLLRAGVGWKEGAVGRITVGADADSQAGYTLLSKDAVIVDDLKAETRFSGPRLLHDHHVVSGISVIISGKERPYGVLGAHTSKRRAFTRDDIHFLESIANILAEAIQREKTEDLLERQTAALHELHAISTLPGLDDQKRCDEVVSAMASFFEVPVAAAKRFKENRVESLSFWERGEIKRGPQSPLAGTPCDEVRKTKATLQYQGLLSEQFPSDSFLSAFPYRSYAGSPIFDSRGDVQGILNLVHEEPKIYSEDDLRILGLFAQLIGAFLERGELEERLRHAQKLDAIGQLSGGIAHEFNNLLTAIIGNLQLAGRKLEGNKECQTLLAQSDQAAHRAAQLTKQLLSFSRRAAVNLSAENLHRIAEEVVRLLRQTIDRRISVTIESDDNLWPVLADAAQMHQVIMNLCVNSRDALMEELVRPDRSSTSNWKPGIRINIENIPAEIIASRSPQRGTPAEYVCLSVFDNGCGMDQNVQERIFEPFFTTKELGRGTGLGLATVYGIVEQHNGWVEFSSQKHDGTTFKVYLPRTHQTERPDVPTAPAEPAPIVGGHETILLVDDEAPIRRLGETILTHHGYAVLLAADGTEAVEIFSRGRDKIRLVVLDLTMPKQSGWDALREIRRIDPRARVIVSSGHRLDKRLKEISEQEDVRFIPKPYRPDDLARIVREELDRPVA